MSAFFFFLIFLKKGGKETYPCPYQWSWGEASSSWESLPSYPDIHQSGITYWPLTGEVNNTDYLLIMAPVSGWDILALAKHCCRPFAPFHGNSIPWLLWPLSAGQCTVLQSKNGSGMVWGAQPRVWGVDLASKFSRSQSSRASVRCAGQTSPIHRGPTSQFTGLICWCQHTFRGLVEAMPRQVRAALVANGDQHNIRQVVIMLCLIGVIIAVNISSNHRYVQG